MHSNTYLAACGRCCHCVNTCSFITLSLILCGEPECTDTISSGASVLDPLKILKMMFVTLAYARRTGAAVRLERRRRERLALFAVRGRRASRSGTRVARQAFQCMRNTLSHMLNHNVHVQYACSLLRSVLILPCYEYLSQAPLLPSIPPPLVSSCQVIRPLVDHLDFQTSVLLYLMMALRVLL